MHIRQTHRVHHAKERFLHCVAIVVSFAAELLMIVVAMVARVLVLVVNVLVWAGGSINMAVEVSVIDVREIIVAAVVIALECVVPISYSGGVLVVEVLIDVLTVLLAGGIDCVVIGISVEVLADVHVEVCAAVMTALVELPMPTRVEEFSCWAVFDRWPRDLLNCNHVLQAWMPSYHV